MNSAALIKTARIRPAGDGRRTPETSHRASLAVLDALIATFQHPALRKASS